MSKQRNETIEDVASYFCGHNPELPCDNCYEKARRALLKTGIMSENMSDEELAVREFNIAIESEDLKGYVKNLEKQVSNTKPKWGQRVVNVAMSTIAIIILIGIVGGLSIGTIILFRWLIGMI